MNRLLTLVVLLVSSIGLTYPVVASSEECVVMRVEHYIDKDGVKMPRVIFDAECSSKKVYDPELDNEYKLEVLPPNGTDPKGSFRVHDTWSHTMKTYIPQPDGTLKVRPW